MIPKWCVVFCVVFPLLIINIESAAIIDIRTDIGDSNWWKHAVVYQIYPRSFKDANNDGIGDLKGIISKLDHLKDAGVTAAWLSPIYKSPQIDQGYDISDFKEIDAQYGTMDDFEEMVEKAHNLGIKIIMDFVPNHSSDKHEWFLKSVQRDPEYDDFYVWRKGDPDTPPNNWLSAFRGSAWQYHEERQEWYLRTFAKEQPDLNYENPNVLAKMDEVLVFWLDKGVDGFRMDAVPYLCEDQRFLSESRSFAPNVTEDDPDYLKHDYTMDQPLTYELIYHWRDLLDNYVTYNGGDERVMMTEAYTDIKNTMKYYGNETHNGAHFTFNFQFITKLNKQSNARDTVLTIKEWLDFMPVPYTPNWVLGNHDRHRVATRFGPERADSMNMLSALLPGVMVTYMGEEIGQENGEVTWAEGWDPIACNSDKELFEQLSRDFERTPFHWDTTINAGFNKGAKPWLPVSSKYIDNNLELQKVPGSNSHYHIYQDLLKLRQTTAFRNGKLNLVALSDNVLAFSREYESELYITIINIGNKEEIIDLSNFKSVNKYVKVIVINKQSKRHERIISSNNIVLAPYEGMVTKAIPDVNQGSVDWWGNAVFYQIYPRSFKDDNNDGIGDLKGITSKLKHLNDAGITATWLSPIYKSPQIDQGYDISDFMNIDEDYGTLTDFDDFVKKAHELGIKVIMDFVPNHSSDKHKWFIKSENKEPGYEDYYIWRDGKNGDVPNNWLSLFKYSAWKYSEKRKQYYYHAFAEAQPDLNYRNPLVVNEMKEVLKFWLDRGVDGFRMDAVPFLFENEELTDEPKSGNHVPSNEHGYLKHIYTSDLPETFDMIYQWRALIDDYSKEHGGDARIMMTEAYTDIENTMKYYGDDIYDGAHFTFNFQFVTKVNQKSTARDIVTTVEEWMYYMPSSYKANWVLGNHDNARVATRFGPQRVDAMNMLAAFLPGVMVTYNGEEIGQENGEVTWEEGKDPSACNGDPSNFDKVSRDFERTPFHWDDSTNAGFNEGRKPWLPVSQKYKTNNLAAQKVSSSKSHFRVYQELLRLRQLPTFVKGSLSISAFSTSVLAFLRDAAHEPAYVVVMNIGGKEENVDISSLEGVKKKIKVVVTDINSNKRDSTLSTNNITLAPYESFVARVLPDPDWWKHAVFYQIYPRSFKDDNNDGIGDLKGIISKLPYLKDAGITAAWLSPIYKSPQVDQGYDISDFMDIHYEYGTLEVFDELVEKAHALGIKIIMDFVPNHSSDKHQWFIDSEAGVEEFKDYYIWRDGNPDTPPNNWKSHFNGPAWTYSPIRKQWYLRQFAKEQPDLNYRNEFVRKNMKDVLKFWMDRKVDGFRMDAVPYLVEHESFDNEPTSGDPNAQPDEHGYLNHTYTSDQPETYDVIYEWREFIDEYNKNHGDEDPRILMAEAYTSIELTMRYYGDEERDGAHFPFNFFLITDLTKSSTAEDFVNAINEWISNMPEGKTANWVLGNHDQHRVATRIGPEKIDGMNMLNALLPGIMVTYNGEEIGQENGEVSFEEGWDPRACNAPPENFDKLTRDFERTPFHWDNSDNAGFNEGTPPWLPVSEKHKTNNLAAQRSPGKKSHYNVYKRLLQLRQESAFESGPLEIKAFSDNVLGFIRGSADEKNSYVVLINIANTQETIDLSVFGSSIQNIKVVVASINSYKKDRILPTGSITLEPYESIVARILLSVSYGDQDWWKTAVFYQIYPRSFKDDDNDGLGDLQGIISKLEHLKDAGVTAAWLSPIYKSPQVDQGYDISNFLDIDGDYGTLDDFDILLKKAHELGIKIVMDFVPNHSSDKHMWFIQSENRDEDYEDYYIWRDGLGDGKPPNNWISRFKYSAWKYSEKRKQYYLHQFAEAQPDLNYRNPVVVERMKEVLRFWLDKGVDGFRMDAVPFLFEDEQFRDEPLSGLDVPPYEYEYLHHIYTNDVSETFDIIYQWREFLDDYVKENGGDARVMMTEAYTDLENTMKYYGNDTHNGAHFTFNFELITKLNISSNAVDVVDIIQTWNNAIPDRFISNWVLGNHDNSRVATRFGPENVDGFNMLIALLPGIMITYNGEEIGQENGEVTWDEGWDPSACNGEPGDFIKISRDFERTPFHWDTSENAGFNNGTKPWLPVSEKHLETNLAVQSEPSANSHYQIYKKLLELRKEATIVTGSLDISAVSDNIVLCRRVLANNPTYIYLFNIGDEEATLDLGSKISSPPTHLKVVLKNVASARTIGDTVAVEGLKLAPHECVIATQTEVPNSAVNVHLSLVIFILSVSILSVF